jgi:hypothetical protein
VSDILIIEDDEILRDLVADWLSWHLSGVLQSMVADSRPSMITLRVVVTDICMPAWRRHHCGDQADAPTLP